MPKLTADALVIKIVNGERVTLNFLYGPWDDRIARLVEIRGKQGLVQGNYDNLQLIINAPNSKGSARMALGWAMSLIWAIKNAGG